MSFFNATPDIIKFGMWGPPGSGKTTFITMLQFADCEGWSIKPRGEETQNLYIEYSETLRDKWEFVPATIADRVWYLSFDFESPKGFFQKKTFRVVLPEAAGEYYEKPDLHPELLTEMYRYQGIIWLVDPERIDNPDPTQRSYRRMIQEWLYRLHELQGGGTLKHRMAFCLTKMDLPDYSKHINDPRNFCLDKLGSDVEKTLSNYCEPNRINFFATSAVGFIPGTTESSRDPNDPTKIIKPSNSSSGSSEPINLFSPFSWLFGQF